MTQVSTSLNDQLAPGAVGFPAHRTNQPISDQRDHGLAPSRWWQARVSGSAVDLAVVTPFAVVLAASGRVAPQIAVAVLVLWPLLLRMSGSQARCVLDTGVGAHVGPVLRAGVGLAVLCWLASPLLASAAEPRLMVPTVLSLTAAGCAVALPRTRRRARVVLAGHPREVHAAMDELHGAGRHRVVAVSLTRSPDTAFDAVPVHLGIDEAADLAERHRADALVVMPGTIDPSALRRLEWAASRGRTHLYLGTGLLDVDPRRTRVVSEAGLTMVHVGAAALRGPRRTLKELIEWLAAALALALLLPLLVAVAVAIRLESHGPALFRQQRVGRDGKAFTMLKFRSMGTTAETERPALVAEYQPDGVLFKLPEDPRVTRLGRLLRRYSIDELPQLWNVVAGDMALVGPRPALPDEVARYDVEPRRRLAVKPGLTGLWQVSGRSDLSWDETVRLDLKYVDNWSLRLDLSIVRRTFGAVLNHRGAY